MLTSASKTQRQHALGPFESGFTMLELLIVIVIVAILAAMVGPSFTSNIARNQINTVRDSLARSAQFARIEAIKRRMPVTVCTSRNFRRCSGSRDWHEGWMIFVDENGNGRRNGRDRIIQVFDQKSGQVETFDADDGEITFDKLGRITTTPGNFGFCHPELEKMRKSLSVTRTGLVTIAKETTGGC